VELLALLLAVDFAPAVAGLDPEPGELTPGALAVVPGVAGIVAGSLASPVGCAAVASADA